MQGLALYLQRARDRNLIEQPNKASPPSTRHENEENEIPDNARCDTENSEPVKLKSCLKPARAQEDRASFHTLDRSAPLPQEPVDAHAESLAKSVVWAASLDSDEEVGAEEQQFHQPKQLDWGTESAVMEESKDVTALPMMEDFCLPGMDAYRDTRETDSEDEKGHMTAEDGDEDSEEEEDEDTLLNLTSLITTTKQLSLGNSRENHARKRSEIRRVFGQESKKTTNEQQPIERQSISEMEESDVPRASEVILSSFPLLSHDYDWRSDTNATPLRPLSRQEERKKIMDMDGELFNLDIGLLSCSDDEDDKINHKKVPRCPPNTPLIGMCEHSNEHNYDNYDSNYDNTSNYNNSSSSCSVSNESNSSSSGNNLSPPGSPSGCFRRSSVTYTPNSAPRPMLHNSDSPVFRRGSAVYTPPRQLSPPRTPPKTQETRKQKPPKTEALQKTKSRIGMATPVLCRTSPLISGVHPGSLTAPVKSRAQPVVPTRRLIAVADTNVLLRNLDLVENTQNYPMVTLVIPSAVVRELDGLKNGDSLVARDARTALHSLRKLIRGAESRTTIKFQNIDEVPKSRSHRGHTRSNDDRILDCCLYYAENLEEGQKVILLTNDVALQVKAESFGQTKHAPRLLSAMGMRAFYEEVWRLT